MSRQALARMIADANRIVVFTGAGISTESGIPDFRSPGGVWSRMKPIYFKDFISDIDKRREAWERAFTGRAGWTGRLPNIGHDAIARLVRGGRASAVITQNVDNLHQDSGVPADQVIELHGNASFATCLECGLRHELADLKSVYELTGDLPSCRECGGIVKTATISFGQPMPPEPMMRAAEHSKACDLFLVLGSSLTVYPASAFPMHAKRHGASVAIVNRDPTELDQYADFVLHDELGETVSQAVALAFAERDGTAAET
ncbi:SIR2 family NAD-dependent protein deacylase [Phenylobacterium immobile]|uniref:SIR2 family NAD-dependent protein deacylase n=1 Tax=Phenylobacterium immobile TaxID=21 RepID=UPI000B853014|nr:Sir2 family NAD-dependent protein deacetylase [Phenylobacterium immobile]